MAVKRKGESLMILAKAGVAPVLALSLRLPPWLEAEMGARASFGAKACLMGEGWAHPGRRTIVISHPRAASLKIEVVTIAIEQ